MQHVERGPAIPRTYTFDWLLLLLCANRARVARVDDNTLEVLVVFMFVIFIVWLVFDICFCLMFVFDFVRQFREETDGSEFGRRAYSLAILLFFVHLVDSNMLGSICAFCEPSWVRRIFYYEIV